MSGHDRVKFGEASGHSETSQRSGASGGAASERRCRGLRGATPLGLNMTDLETRVLNAVPAAAFEMNALLSLVRIEDTRAVPTASVSCERRPVLRVNPDFVREHCRSDEHLFLLVMHELHHVLLGHTRLFPRATPAHNIAFDAVINAMLVARFAAEAHRSFFVDLYGDEDGPLRLLAPPTADRAISDPALARLHQLLYGDQGVTSEEVFNAIATALGAMPAPDGILLGDHAGPDEDVWGTDGRVDPEFVKAIRQIVEKWPRPEHTRRGRSLADLLERVDVRPLNPGATVLAVLRRALLGAARRRHAGALTELRPTLRQDVIPAASDRRAAVARAAGTVPLLYWRASRRCGGRSGRARVYVDVSGSMDEYIPFLYGALAALRDHVDSGLWLFSTKVTPIPMAAFRRGIVTTTGGTEIACVLEHALQNRVRKVLVITDGYVGEPTREHVIALARSRTEVRVVLTPDGWRDDLVGIAARIDELPDVSDRDAHLEDVKCLGGWTRTGRPTSRRRRLPVALFRGAEHEVVFADGTRAGTSRPIGVEQTEIGRTR